MTRALAFALVLAACHKPVRPAVDEPPISVPSAEAPVLDGHLDDATWARAFVSRPFEDAEGETSPHSQLRLAADDEKLYLALEFADEDLLTHPPEHEETEGDRARIQLGSLEIVLSPGGAALTNGVRAGLAVEGTVDDSADTDTRWTAELAIPRAALGADPRAGIPLRAVRLDLSGREKRTLAFPREKPVTLHLPVAPAAPTKQ